MRIEQPHSLGQQEAIGRIQQAITRLLEQSLPAGVTVKDVVHQWHGGQLDFSFKAAKGFFGTTISGRADVTDDTVALDLTLPPIVTTFMGEDTIRRHLGERLGGLLRGNDA